MPLLVSNKQSLRNASVLLSAQHRNLFVGRVKRVLPDKIRIEITERTQVAAVVYGENYVVIDSEETVLRKTEVEPQLTLIRGLTISGIEVGEPIEV